LLAIRIRKKEEGRRKKEEGRRKRGEEGRRKKEEGRRKRGEKGRGEKKEGSRKQDVDLVSLLAIRILLLNQRAYLLFINRS
jgi:hypothetical protein